MFKYFFIVLLFVSVYGGVTIFKCDNSWKSKDDSENISRLVVNKCDGDSCQIVKGKNITFDFDFKSKSNSSQAHLKFMVRFYDKINKIIQFPNIGDGNICNISNAFGHIKKLDKSADLCSVKHQLKADSETPYTVNYAFLVPMLIPSAEISVKIEIEGDDDLIACGIFHGSFVDKAD